MIPSCYHALVVVSLYDVCAFVYEPLIKLSFPFQAIRPRDFKANKVLGAMFLYGQISLAVVSQNQKVKSESATNKQAASL